MIMTVYNASAPVELSTTAGENVTPALTSVGGTGEVADDAAAAIGNIVNAAVNIHTYNIQCLPRPPHTHTQTPTLV